MIIQKKDEFRSYANYNMALYYSEQPQDSNTLKKCREYADKVLYKDMYPGFYYIFGIKTDSKEYVYVLHKTIDDSVNTIKSGLRNLARHYRRKGNIEKYEYLMEFQNNFNLNEQVSKPDELE